MLDTELYSRILGIVAPWSVDRVELSDDAQVVTVSLSHDRSVPLHCPECNQSAPGYDRRQRQWRHLDTCQFTTIVSASVPRVQCPEHGVRQINVPWAESGSGYTALFEALVIDLRTATSTRRVAALIGLGWDAVDGILHRAVARGLARRTMTAPVHLGVDAIAVTRGHRYQTILSDQTSGAVLHVADDRTTDSFGAFLSTLTPAQREAIRTIAMDMWPAYICAAIAHIPEAEKKICFDKFHVAQHLSRAVDQVRRREHAVLLKAGDRTLTKTKYLWLRNPDHMTDAAFTKLEALSKARLKTARAWGLKETAMLLWTYVSRHWGRTGWMLWYNKAIRSRLEPIKKVARMIKKHLWGILNAMAQQRTNALAESINSRIARIKHQACGFRNPERMKTMIYFHLGQLDLYPTPLHSANSPTQ